MTSNRHIEDLDDIPRTLSSSGFDKTIELARAMVRSLGIGRRIFDSADKEAIVTP